MAHEKKLKELEEKIECICPLCKKIHIKELYWTGIGMPRKYCTPCLSTVSGTFNAIQVGIKEGTYS